MKNSSMREFMRFFGWCVILAMFTVPCFVYGFDFGGQLKKLKDSGALIILFGSKQSKVVSSADFLVDNGLPSGVVPAMNAAGDSALIGPVAPMAIGPWHATQLYS